jgi:hypothetical protein
MVPRVNNGAVSQRSRNTCLCPSQDIKHPCNLYQLINSSLSPDLIFLKSGSPRAGLAPNELVLSVETQTVIIAKRKPNVGTPKRNAASVSYSEMD